MSEPIQAGVGLSDSAVKRLHVLAAKESKPVMLRLAVHGGGCQGVQYKFDFADAPAADDRVFEKDGARLVVDTISLDLLTGAEVNYVESLMGSYFEVRNPNAASSCGCGTSFSIA
jgi:iron-sulfur cluster assembly accessory protein